MDLLLGCYRNGGLYLRLNEGSPAEMKFAATNQPVKVGNEPVVFEGGIGAPRIADWDNDGLFDILIGTIYGGSCLASECRFTRCTLVSEHDHACRGIACLLYTSPSPRDQRGSRMPSSA